MEEPHIESIVKQDPLEELFSFARKGFMDDYIITLLRPKGISQYPDTLWMLHESIDTKDLNTDTVIECLSLIYNLIEQGYKRDYNPFPFMELYADGTVSSKINLVGVLDLIKSNSQKENALSVGEELEKVFTSQVINSLQNDKNEDLENAFSYLKELAGLYFKERKEFKPPQIFHKLPNFEVLEILLNEECGLYGFNRYFSNGSKANYERHKDKTTGLNVLTSFPINYMVGMLSDLKREWWVGDKRLYEIGIAGRYNVWGEWKPVEYKGNTDNIYKECRELAKGDHKIEGILFYILCTGHRIIEFVIRTPIDMPSSNFSMAGHMHLHKCKPIEEFGTYANDYVYYDAHYELEKVDLDSIEIALTSIKVVLNRWAFCFNSTVEWVLKYSTHSEKSNTKAIPKEKDMELINKILTDFPKMEEATVLDVGIDWYHQAKRVMVTNKFVAFLSYFIALESILSPITEGDVTFGLVIPKETKSEKKQRILGALNNNYKDLLPEYPAKYIENLYFNDVKTIGKKLKESIEAIFGKDHEYIKNLFENIEDDISLIGLRGKLAHGDTTLLSKKDEEIISEKVFVLEEIVEALIKKLLVKQGEEFPKWSRSYTATIDMSDPRGTMVTSDTNMLGGRKDWRIRPEWFN